MDSSRKRTNRKFTPDLEEEAENKTKVLRLTRWVQDQRHTSNRDGPVPENKHQFNSYAPDFQTTRNDQEPESPLQEEQTPEQKLIPFSNIIELLRQELAHAFACFIDKPSLRYGETCGDKPALGQDHSRRYARLCFKLGELSLRFENYYRGGSIDNDLDSASLKKYQSEIEHCDHSLRDMFLFAIEQLLNFFVTVYQFHSIRPEDVPPNEMFTVSQRDQLSALSTNFNLKKVHLPDGTHLFTLVLRSCAEILPMFEATMTEVKNGRKLEPAELLKEVTKLHATCDRLLVLLAETEGTIAGII